MMSKAKRLEVRKPSTGEIIATSANQIVRLKFQRTYKNVVLFTRPPFPLAVLKGGSGDETTKNSVKHRQPRYKGWPKKIPNIAQ